MLTTLASGKSVGNFRYAIFKLISATDGWGISIEIALRWISLDLTDDKSTLFQVMAWCRQATIFIWANVDPDLCRYMVAPGHNELTHWGWDKMSAILHMTFFKCIFLNKRSLIFTEISLKFIRKGPIDNKPVLVQIMAWRHTGDKPLSEPMIA